VVLHGSAEAKALVADGLPASSLGLWCHIAAEVVGGFRRLVVGCIAGVGFGYATEVVGVGGCCTSGAGVPAEALASALADG
jgi:hypothetical protein